MARKKRRFTKRRHIVGGIEWTKITHSSRGFPDTTGYVNPQQPDTTGYMNPPQSDMTGYANPQQPDMTGYYGQQPGQPDMTGYYGQQPTA